MVAVPWGASRGPVFTVRQAIRSGKPAAVVLAGGGATLPAFAGGAWSPCSLGSVAAFRWVPAPDATRQTEEAEPKRTALHRVFVVPDGKPVHALMEHISSLAPGERLWFEHGVLAGDIVLAPHEALCDTPPFLALPRLRRRFCCTTREAAGLAVFLALDAGPDGVTYYEAEARRRSVAGVIEDPVHLVARLALAEEVAAGDALDDAERLGDAVEAVTTEGRVTEAPAGSDVHSAFVAWHVVGSVVPETIACAACGARYDLDDDNAEVPACPECGAPDTWESRQGAAFRAPAGDITGCPSLAELGAIGKRLYALRLSHDQASVAWTRYRLRQTALEAAVTLGVEARRLLGEIERASERDLPRPGVKVYPRQRCGAVTIAGPEWRRLWQAYAAPRRARAA